MKYSISYLKKIVLVFFITLSSFKLFGLFIIRKPFEENDYAYKHIQNQIYSNLCNYIKNDSAFHIPDSLYDNIDLIFKYNQEGELTEIRNMNANSPYPIFTEQDLVRVFDYSKNLPPFEIPNTKDKIQDQSSAKYIYIDTIMDNYYNYLKICGYTIWCNSYSMYLYEYNDSGARYEINIDSILPKIQIDSVFGEMSWVEVKKKYYASGVDEDDYFRKKEIKKNNMSTEGYYWTKIPINKYNVHIQIPDSSKIALSPDSLSANVKFPDSSRLIISYSKDRIVNSNIQNDKDELFDKIFDMKRT